MIHKNFFSKRSVLLILLTSSAFNPLLALQHEPYSIVKNTLQISNVKIDIRNILIGKGLDKDIAISKTNKLFFNHKHTANTLSDLYNYPEIFISKEKLNDVLATYALYEKHLDLSSYNSLVSLAQTVSLQSLSTKHLNTLKHLAATP
ncbi:hypothetical protein SMGD1_2823 [Sulfurimonas gotlandica GD1]|uniref:DUF4142 domain-containing protein n=1 Tax=Sulfurimonas gotlandica (strain DSM 19862 / JCM 16533 / GD1) TaxID=929558 RepID=B6BJU5_SULGG|nr:hypothetical protein [Sulfurimonas gotlandica]EDZ62473.1 hypothetical protein CBGD1_2040 [Sulfurimonas gotlandica GD1]EHP31345.1 hypothetical protein SMGD1_2823 [Sulfurimonas gotlandica GD1]